MAQAIKVMGRRGRYDKLINGTFEPTDGVMSQHNGYRVYCARGVAPVYIYHTGTNRWVISKRLDDGSKCYAYAAAGSTKSPADVEGPWVCCNAGGEWGADANITCTPCPAANDPFMQLRVSVEAELQKLGLHDEKSLKQLWRRLDYNGNNIVSLAEIDKMVVELCAGGIWPDWLNNKPALMRAYKKTILKDGDGDSWVEKKEFHALMLNIFWFNKLFLIFQAIDSGHDRRIDANEFVHGMSRLGLNLSPGDGMQVFNEIDTNHGGQVLFVEFCAYIRKRVNPDSDPNFDADIVSGENCAKALRHAHGEKATHSHMVKKKSMRMFNEVETKIKSAMKDRRQLREMWDRMDFNGNNIVSLAEIDKFVVEKFPVLNHKPALMRAYKYTISRAGGGDGDDWVEKKEFKALLGNLFYFNKIFWVFEQGDEDKDRRLTFPDFKRCLVVCGAKMSEAEMHSDFQKVDRNHGGIILFDEFCYYFTAKSCPECLQDWVD